MPGRTHNLHFHSSGIAAGISGGFYFLDSAGQRVGKPIATFELEWVGPDNLHALRTVHLADFAVQLEYRFKPSGELFSRYLMHKLLEYKIADGRMVSDFPMELIVTAGSENGAALRLYEAAGFKGDGGPKAIEMLRAPGRDLGSEVLYQSLLERHPRMRGIACWGEGCHHC